MNESREIPLENLMEVGKELLIKVIKHENYQFYFTINDHLYSTHGTKVYHKDSPLFDHPFTDYVARQDSDPDEILQFEKFTKELGRNIELYQKHEGMILRRVILRCAMLILLENDKEVKKEEWKKWLYKMMDVSPSDGAYKMAKEMEKDASDN